MGLLQLCAAFNVSPADKRPNSDTTIVDRYAVQVGKPADVDQKPRGGKTKRQHRDQTLSTSNNFCLVAMFGQNFDRVLQSGGPDIVETMRLHNRFYLTQPRCDR